MPVTVEGPEPSRCGLLLGQVIRWWEFNTSLGSTRKDLFFRWFEKIRVNYWFDAGCCQAGSFCRCTSLNMAKTPSNNQQLIWIFSGHLISANVIFKLMFFCNYQCLNCRMHCKCDCLKDHNINLLKLRLMRTCVSLKQAVLKKVQSNMHVHLFILTFIKCVWKYSCCSPTRVSRLQEMPCFITQMIYHAKYPPSNEKQSSMRHTMI